MCNDESGATAKRTANGLLDETICLCVNGCRCLVQYEDLKNKTGNVTEKEREKQLWKSKSFKDRNDPETRVYEM